MLFATDDTDFHELIKKSAPIRDIVPVGVDPWQRKGAGRRAQQGGNLG
jgi:hypothetical protein